MHPTRSISLLGAIALLTVLAPPVGAQNDGHEQLAAFAAHVLGSWEDDGSRNVFEWGVGQRVVKTRSYFLQDGRWALVSEGMWYWDPGAGSLRGVAVAVGMPVELFEYTSSVEGDEVVHALVSHGDMGGEYEERWRFTGAGYEWSLHQEGQRLMGGSYRKTGAR